jgi:hypothetical protein
MTAKKNLIRRRKTRRLIEKKKLDSEAKDSVTDPADTLPANRMLSNHHDFLAVQIFLMDLEDMVVRKDWSSPIEMWVFRQFEKGSKAHTAFTVFLKSGQGLQLNADIKCYFRDFHHFRETLLRFFFAKLRDPIVVIEKNLKRIKLTLSGVDGPTTPTTLEGFCNTLRFLFNQAPYDAAYPERQQVSRIRERLPKRLPKRPRAIDNRSSCAFCSKPGHLAENCWVKFPDKKRSCNARGRGPCAPTLPLNNITTTSLQAMISQAVENVIASAKNP